MSQTQGDDPGSAAARAVSVTGELLPQLRQLQNASADLGLANVSAEFAQVLEQLNTSIEHLQSEATRLAAAMSSWRAAQMPHDQPSEGSRGADGG